MFGQPSIFLVQGGERFTSCSRADHDALTGQVVEVELLDLKLFARVLDGGCDPLYVTRRMIRVASEDIGNANPNALLLANACFDSINKIGWPEGRIILSQTAIYLATSPKSNAAYTAIKDAQSNVQKTGNLSVPLHLRNAPTKLMKDEYIKMFEIWVLNGMPETAAQAEALNLEE